MGSALRFGVVVCRQVNAFSYFAGALFYLDARGSRRRSSLVGWSSYLWGGHGGCFPGLRKAPSGLDAIRPPFRGEACAPAPAERNACSSTLVVCGGPRGAAPNHSHLIVLFFDRGLGLLSSACFRF